MALGSPLQAGTPIVFVSRSAPSATAQEAVRRADIGRLLLLDESGAVHKLAGSDGSGAASGSPEDVLDPDVSYDARKIVFAGYSAAEYGWRIFEVGADGTGLRQITRSDRSTELSRYGAAALRLEGHDDLDPCYLPDGRICFVSTRYPGIAPNNRLRSTNLFVVGPDGAGPVRITSERFGADTPAVDPVTGQIVYSRWWRSPRLVTVAPPSVPGSAGAGYGGSGDPAFFPKLPFADSNVLAGVVEGEFPGVNSWFLARINPDGTDMAMFSGFHFDRQTTQAYRPSFLPSGDVLAAFIPTTPLVGVAGLNGLRIVSRGPSRPMAVAGPQQFIGLKPVGVPLPEVGQPLERILPIQSEANRFVFQSAVGLANGDYVVSAALAKATAAQFDLFVLDGRSGRMQSVYESPSTAEMDVVLLLPRDKPTVIANRVAGTMRDDAPRDPGEAAADGGTFTFLVENIHFNAPVDAPFPNAPPVGQNLSIEFFMSPQRTSDGIDDAPFLLREEKIGPGGRVEVTLPAGVPLFELLRRPDGTIAKGRDGQIFHVGGMNFNRSGQRARCVGCHAGHSMMAVPEDPSWTNLAPSAVVRTNPEPPSGLLQIQAMIRGLPFQAPSPSSSVFAQTLVDRRSHVLFAWRGDLENDQTTTATLSWRTAIRAREVVLHPAKTTMTDGQMPAVEDPGSQTILRFGLRTLLGEAVQEDLIVREKLELDGRALSVALDAEKPFDSIVLTIQPADVTGLGVLGFKAPAIGDLEVIAQVSKEGEGPAWSFLRGDANCDLRRDVSDVNAILSSLFLGLKSCCNAAADANGDGSVNISDPIALLSYQFLGGEPPPEPSASCGRAPAGDLNCDKETCP